MYMEILLTLKGIKPCTLFWTPVPASVAIYARLVEQHLIPLIDEQRLRDYGFVLRKINHPVATETHCGFQKVYILADTRSEHWPLVQDVFILPHPGQKPDDTRIGKALGYPVPQCNQTKSRHDEYIIDSLRSDIVGQTNRTGIIKYKDETEKKKLRWTTGSDRMGDKVCAIEAFTYRAPVGLCDGGAVRAHFEACERAARSVGRALGLSMPVNGVVQGGTMQDGVVDSWSTEIPVEQQSVGRSAERRASF
jgi:hypothetical protein